MRDLVNRLEPAVAMVYTIGHRITGIGSSRQGTGMVAQERHWIACLGVLTLSLAAGCETQPGAGDPFSSGGTAGQNADQPPGNSPSAAVAATQLEQLSLERINRARLRPAQEASMNGIAIDEGAPGQLDTTPKQPVALNTFLNQSAKAHSRDMLAQSYFEHNSLNGDTPFKRMNDAGYLFATAGENLAWRGTTGTPNEVQYVEQQHTDLFVDSDIVGRGHRLTMLNGSFREVGIGIVRGFFTETGTRYDSIMQTQDFGAPPNSPTFVLGVVYNDNNANGRYDYGEGVPSSPVSIGTATRNTNSAGGYSFAITQSGNYTLQFSGNNFQGLNINRGQKNIKVDLVNGNTIVINLGVGILN